MTATISNFGRAVGVNPDNVFLDDATKIVDTGETLIFSGQPLYLGTGTPTGVPVLHAYDNIANNLRVYGIAKFNKNIYSDETKGGLGGIYGGGYGAVLRGGIITVRPISFIDSNDLEVVSTPYTASVLSAAVGAPLYVSLLADANQGKITDVLTAPGAGQNELTKFGYINKLPTATVPVLEIELI